MPGRRPVPIACTLEPAEQADRGSEFEVLFRRALVDVRRDADRLELRFRREAEDAVRDLWVREQQCCAFLEVTFDARDDETRVTVSGPVDAGPVLDAFYELGRQVRS